MEAIGKGYEKIVRFYISTGILQLLIDSHNDEQGDRDREALNATACIAERPSMIKPLLQ